MIPSIDDRLASVVRALSDIILPALPPEAGLAIEQTHLAIGQLQIICAQLPAAAAHEQEEADDARTLALKLLEDGDGGPRTKAALAGLGKAAELKSGARETRVAIHEAIDGLVRQVATDGDSHFRAAIGGIIVQHQQARTMKDRKWFTAMGFDAGM
jgi:hypothetical protein